MAWMPHASASTCHDMNQTGQRTTQHVARTLSHLGELLTFMYFGFTILPVINPSCERYVCMMYVYVYVCMYVYVCVRMYVYVCIRICMYVYTYREMTQLLERSLL